MSATRSSRFSQAETNNLLNEKTHNTKGFKAKTKLRKGTAKQKRKGCRDLRFLSAFLEDSEQANNYGYNECG